MHSVILQSFQIPTMDTHGDVKHFLKIMTQAIGLFPNFEYDWTDYSTHMI